MQIATSTIYNDLASQMQGLSTSQNQLETEVSSGLAVTQPSDNPTVMNDALNNLQQSDQTTQYLANGTTALNVAQASYSALTQLNDLSNQLSTIATEAGSATATSTDLQNYGTQVNELLQQAVELGNTQFDGSYLYSGTAVNTAPFATTQDADGNITAVTYAGNSGQSTIPISATSSVAPTPSGQTNQSLADFMNQIVSLRDALNSGDTAGVTTADTALTASNDTIITATADSSAMQARIEAEQSVQTSLNDNLQSTLSNETSADLPTTMIKLTEAETAYQAVLEASGKIMQTSLMDYISVG